MLNISQVILVRTDSNLCRKELTVHWSAPNSLIRSYLQHCTNSMWGDESEAVAPIIWLYQTVHARKEEVFFPDLLITLRRHAFPMLLPLLCHMVPLHNRNRWLTMPIVKVCMMCYVILLRSGCLNVVKAILAQRNMFTINLWTSSKVILFTWPQWANEFHWNGGMMPHVGVCYMWDYLMPGICSLIIPPLQRIWKGGILVSCRPSVCPSVCLSVCPSVCGQNRVCSVSPTILARSISYFHILSSYFRRCGVCKGYYEILKCEFLAIFWNLYLWLLMTWDLIWIHSMGNHGAARGILRTQRF